MAAGDLQPRLDAVKQLLGLFRLERLAYLSVTLLALAILIASAIIMLVKDTMNAPLVTTGLFGSAGVITFTTGRLLLMWNQAFTAILGAVKEKSPR